MCLQNNQIYLPTTVPAFNSYSERGSRYLRHTQAVAKRKYILRETNT